MDAKFNVTVNPRIKKLKELMALDAKTMAAIARDIDIQFVKNERRLFATEGASGGPKWITYQSVPYERFKKRVRPGRKLMVFDGDLRKTLTNRNAPGHALSWTLKPRPSVSVGTNDIKAAWHGPKAGNPLANPRLPVRDVLQHTPKTEAKYYASIRRTFKFKKERVERALAAWPKSASGTGTA